MRILACKKLRADWPGRSHDPFRKVGTPHTSFSVRLGALTGPTGAIQSIIDVRPEFWGSIVPRHLTYYRYVWKLKCSFCFFVFGQIPAELDPETRSNVSGLNATKISLGAKL